MAMTDAELDLRAIIAQAKRVQDYTERQLSVLRNTYPLWVVNRVRDIAGQPWWTAHLRYEATPEMLAIGLKPYAQEGDPISMAATLAWHTYLFNRWRLQEAPPM